MEDFPEILAPLVFLLRFFTSVEEMSGCRFGAGFSLWFSDEVTG